jgi:DNA repair protein RecO (recombination protein O)
MSQSSQSFQTTEGIILKAIPFRDYDHILTLFTPDAGLIKVLYRFNRGGRRGLRSLCDPLTKVEVVYRENRGEIYTCREIHSIDALLSLRERLSSLQAACDLVQAIQASQWIGKPAPLIYHLFCFYLKKISVAEYPWGLAASFRLKLLKHDGIISFPPVCSECGKQQLEEVFTAEGESWCAAHRPLGSCFWNRNELEILSLLTDSLSYHEICRENISPELFKKITILFEGCF